MIKLAPVFKGQKRLSLYPFELLAQSLSQEDPYPLLESFTEEFPTRWSNLDATLGEAISYARLYLLMHNNSLMSSTAPNPSLKDIRSKTSTIGERTALVLLAHLIEQGVKGKEGASTVCLLVLRLIYLASQREAQRRIKTCPVKYEDLDPGKSRGVKPEAVTGKVDYTKAWILRSWEVEDDITCAPALHTDGTIIFGTRNGNILRLDLEQDGIQGIYTLPGQMTSSSSPSMPVAAPLILPDGSYVVIDSFSMYRLTHHGLLSTMPFFQFLEDPYPPIYKRDWIVSVYDRYSYLAIEVNLGTNTVAKRHNETLSQFISMNPHMDERRPVPQLLLPNNHILTPSSEPFHGGMVLRYTDILMWTVFNEWWLPYGTVYPSYVLLPTGQVLIAQGRNLMLLGD